MSELNLDMLTSLDGFVAGPEQSARTRSESAVRALGSSRSHITRTGQLTDLRFLVGNSNRVDVNGAM